MRVRFALSAVVLAVGLLPAAAGAQGSPSEGTEPGGGSSGPAAPDVDGLGGSVVLDGVVSFGSGVSGDSEFVGFSRTGRVGSLEVSSVDGQVFGGGWELFTLAQLQGAVDVGPAAGTTDAVALTVFGSADLSQGFWLAVGDHLLSSDGATVPAGETSAGGTRRYWLWDSPCRSWDEGDTERVRIVAFGEDPAQRWTDASLGSLEVSGAQLAGVFDPAALVYTATAPAGAEQVTVEAAAPFACALEVSPLTRTPTRRAIRSTSTTGRRL